MRDQRQARKLLRLDPRLLVVTLGMLTTGGCLTTASSPTWGDDEPMTSTGEDEAPLAPPLPGHSPPSLAAPSASPAQPLDEASTGGSTGGQAGDTSDRELTTGDRGDASTGSGGDPLGGGTPLDLPMCGDGLVDEDEECDTGELLGATCEDFGLISGRLSCGPVCRYDFSQCDSQGDSVCGNPHGGPLRGDNGTGIGVDYCYDEDDTVAELALKACESHYGKGECCIVTGLYHDQQVGLCDAEGRNDMFHWHWDDHPEGQCGADYVVGDVLSPGACGEVVGSFLPGPGSSTGAPGSGGSESAG